jgi:hypothetical protein
VIARSWRLVIRFLLCLALAPNKHHEDQAATYQGCAATYQRPTYDIDTHSSDPTRVCRHDPTAVPVKRLDQDQEPEASGDASGVLIRSACGKRGALRLGSKGSRIIEVLRTTIRLLLGYH